MTYSPWHRRVASSVIDAAVLVPLALIGTVTSSTGFAATCAALNLVVVAVNRWNGSGRSLGRRVLGTRLVDGESGAPVGPVRAFARDVCHTVDWLVLGLGWLRPLWHRHRQTWADSIVASVVVPMAGGNDDAVVPAAELATAV